MRERTLMRVELSVHVDENRLAGLDVALEFEAGDLQGDALGGDHVLLRLAGKESFGAARAEDERANSVEIAEAEHSDAGDHGNDAVTAFAAAMHLFNGSEDVLGCGIRGAALGEGVREDVQHYLGVRGGVEVSQVALEDTFDDLGDVGEVAVMREDDAVGRVHVERLRFGDGAATGCGIAHMADAGIAEQLGHVSGVEDICYQAVAFVEIETVFK